MAVFATGSRYQLDSSKKTASRKPLGSVSFSLHRVVEGDTLRNIAARLLGNDSRWWEIADINPQVKFPEDITVGSSLRIPR